MNNFRVFILVILHLMVCDIFAQSGVTKTNRNDIQTLVGNLLGENHVVADIVNVDSAVGNRFVADGAIEDPYATLTNCFIYSIVSHADSNFYNPNGAIGIYQNGQIVWQSDTIIPGSEAYGIDIKAVTDLNDDGKVDIIASNYTGGADYEHLWIFSWDGLSGSRINALDSANESILIGAWNSFGFVDIDGDNVKEIIIEWYETEDSDEFTPITYSWNGQLYGKWSVLPRPLPTGDYPRNKILVNVRSKISFLNNNFKYRYSAYNQLGSKQKIDDFSLEIPAELIKNFISPEYWTIGTYMKNIVHWGAYFVFDRFIGKGETDSLFSYESVGLPGIVKYYIRGHNPVYRDDRRFNIQKWYEDIQSNSVVGFTVGPRKLPISCNVLNLFDTLSFYINRSRTLGWIMNDETANKYTTLFDSARSKLLQGDISNLHLILNTVLSEVNIDSSSALSNEAYALIRYNTEYLVSVLPATEQANILKLDIVGSGSIEKSPENCFYESGDTIQLTAMAAPGNIFSTWSGDVEAGHETENPVSIKMNEKKHITAVFVQHGYIITPSSDGDGIISPSVPIGIEEGTDTTFIMKPDSGYRVDSVFIDDEYQTSDTIYIFHNVSAHHTIRVTFIPIRYKLNLNTPPSSVGEIKKRPNKDRYDIGEEVAIEVFPYDGYDFTGWSGDVPSGHEHDNPLTIIMDNNKTIKANFIKE